MGKLTEQAYTQEKVAGYNKEQPGKGEQWLQAWKSNRAARYEHNEAMLQICKFHNAIVGH